MIPDVVQQNRRPPAPRVRQITEDELIYLASIEDEYSTFRQTFCSLCDDRDSTRLAMSVCCQKFRCLECCSKFLTAITMRCLFCNVNWGPYTLSDVLVPPPCLEDPTDNDVVKATYQSRWRALVESEKQDREKNFISSS